MRKVNRIETFKPSEKSRIIINALQGKMKKSVIYNTCIEDFGRALAFEILSEFDYRELIKKISNNEGG